MIDLHKFEKQLENVSREILLNAINWNVTMSEVDDDFVYFDKALTHIDRLRFKNNAAALEFVLSRRNRSKISKEKK